MTEEEYNIRLEFADKFIKGWKGRVSVGNVDIPYTKLNAHCMVSNMSDEEFAEAQANPKRLMRKLNPFFITAKSAKRFFLMTFEHLVAMFAAIGVSCLLGYVTGSEILTAMVAFVLVTGFSSHVLMTHMFRYGVK